MNQYTEGNLAPIVLMTLLDIYCLGKIRTQGQNCHPELSPAQRASLDVLVANDLVHTKGVLTAGVPESHQYMASARGTHYVKALTQMQFPVPMSGWMNPQTQTQIKLKK